MSLTGTQLRNRSIARKAARRAGINPHIFVRQMGAEAGFQDLTSPAGASGPAQIMPGTAASWGVHNVHNPHEAYNAAAQHMAGYLRSYGGSWAKALTAYNAGAARVGGPLPAETQAYIAHILNGKSDHVDVPGQPHRLPRATLTGRSGTIKPGQRPTMTIGGEHVDVKGALLSALLDGNSGSLIKRWQAAIASGAFTTTTPTKINPGKGPKYLAGPRISATVGGGAAPKPGHMPKGTAKFEGTTVAAWIKPILEYARAHGWKGSITSGYRSFADQKRIYDSGVRPAAVPGTSNHEGDVFPRGAVDVDRASAAQLSAILRNSPYAKTLIYAGSKDPVHFSHPHAGGY